MNQMNSSSFEKKIPVVSTNHSDNAFHTALVFFLATFLSIPFFIFLAWQSGAWQLYIIVGVTVLMNVLQFAAARMTRKGRNETAGRLLIGSMLGTMLVGGFLVSGTGLIVGLSAVALTFVMANQTLPTHSLRKAMATAVGTGILMAALDLLNLDYRLTIPIINVYLPVIIVIIVLATGFIIARETWNTSLRSKLLVSMLGTTGLAVLIYGLIVLFRTQQRQAFWSGELQNTIQEQSRQEIANKVLFETHKADETLSQITYSLAQLADYRASLYADALVSQGSHWDGNTMLIKLSDGQYGNATTDPASVFIPNIVTLNSALISDLNASMYLDFSAPAVLKSHPNIVALYYINTGNVTVYYPNIDLANNVPPDFDAIEQPFYTVAIPQNDPEHKAVWTAPYQDPAGTGLIVTNATPVYDQYDRFRGVLAADIQLSKITEQIATINLGKDGFAFLVDSAGRIIAMPEVGYNLFGIPPEVVPINESPKTTLLEQGPTDIRNVAQRMIRSENGLTTVSIQGTEYYVAYAPLPSIGYSMGLIAPSAELEAAYLAAREQLEQETRQTTNLSALILLAVLLAAAGAIFLISRFIAAPLTQLTQVATEAWKGNLNVKFEVQTKDETGTLANVLDRMVTQMRETLATLEERVAERTHSLELAAEVGRAVSQVRDLDVMLKDACELILKEFNLYYVQVYLTDPSGSTLKLEAGTGFVGAQLLGRGHSLPLNTGSINGRAATEKRSVVISDTSQSATFRPNALLPETRAEMAVPLIVADKVVGMLDMQSSQPGVLTEEALPAFEALAGQLAVAIQNANLLAETEEAHAEVEKQARRLVRTSWNEHLDAIHKPEQLGFIFDHSQVTPLTDMAESQLPEDGKAISTSIAVTGESLGSLVVEVDDETRREQTQDLVNVVARQVAQQIENLRLLESAERYRYEAEQASRRLTREGWKSYTEKAGDSLKYIYDLNQVHPLNGETLEASATVPLKVRDEVVGKFAIQGLDTNDTEAVNLANAVAERLSAHIESLRQYDQTQSALAQSEKLFQASRRLTQSESLQDLVVAAVEALGIHEIDRVILGGLDYTSEGDLAGMTIIANWSNRAELQATPVGTHYPKEALNAVSLFKSSQPLFFDDMLNDPRVDESTLTIAKRLNYRAVAALPLYVGSRQDALLLFEGEQPHSFTAEEIRLFTSLAPQLATVLENRRQFERAQEQAKREAMLNVINQKIQSATSVEAVLQIAARELGHALGAPMTIAQLSMKDKSS